MPFNSVDLVLTFAKKQMKYVNGENSVNTYVQVHTYFKVNNYASKLILFPRYGGYHIIKQKVFEGALSWVGYE